MNQGGVEGETFILEGVERETFILGKTNFHFLFPPYQGYGVHISLSRPLNPRQVTAVAPLGETPRPLRTRHWLPNSGGL
jgi:hypothetical protein